MTGADLEYRASAGAPPCPSVAAADVDGDGREDLAFLIRSSKGHILLVAGQQLADSRWKVTLLEDFGPETTSRAFVEPLKAGSYRDASLSPGAPDPFAPEPGRVRSVQSASGGFRAGRFESGSMVFLLEGKRWVHLYPAD